MIFTTLKVLLCIPNVIAVQIRINDRTDIEAFWYRSLSAILYSFTAPSDYYKSCGPNRAPADLIFCRLRQCCIDFVFSQAVIICNLCRSLEHSAQVQGIVTKYCRFYINAIARSHVCIIRSIPSDPQDSISPFILRPYASLLPLP